VIVVDRNIMQIRVQLDALPKDALDALGGAGAADKIAPQSNGASWQLTKVRTDTAHRGPNNANHGPSYANASR
jgi:hypothetical protein